MDCEQLAQLYDEYAIGALQGEERAEMEAHLARNCPQCTPGVANARWVVAHLSLSAPQVEPPPALKSKLMAALGAAGTSSEIANAIATPQITKLGANIQKRRPVFPVWAWAAAAALALITGYSIRQVRIQTAQMADLQKQMKLASLQNQALQMQLELEQQVASVMMSPESKPLNLLPGNKAMPTVHAYMHPHMGVALTADEMPSMPASRTLQLWFVPKKGAPKSIAIFRPSASGQLAVVAPITMPVNEIAALAVTEEPAGGSPQPTTTPAWVAKMN